VHEGDVLKVSSPQGSLELPVYVYPGLRPDVSHSGGQGHAQYGRYASNRGANPLMLLASRRCERGAVLQTGVRVSAVEDRPR
jgi:molybdopterin-containing oxidoreductase family iron-sulfur binding subunit